MAERDLSFKANRARPARGCLGRVSVFRGEAGQHAELDEQLKAIANAKHQPPGVNKGGQTVQQRTTGAIRQVQPALCGRLSRAKIVAVQKTSREQEEIIALKADIRRHNIGKMNHVRPVRAAEAGGMGRFRMGVGSVSRNDKRIDLTHAPPYCLMWLCRFWLFASLTTSRSES